MKTLPLILALCAVVPSPSVAARIETVTPQGQRLTLWQIPEASERQIQAMRATGKGEAMRHVADHPGSWYQLELACEAATLWPAGQRVVAVLADSSRVPAAELFAMSPPIEQEIVPLGLRPTLLDPARLWRRGTVVRLFVRFPLLATSPVAIAVEGRSP